MFVPCCNTPLWLQGPDHNHPHLCRFEPTRVDTLSSGSIRVDELEHEATGRERMYVPASDRYAVVPGSEEPDGVPNSVPVTNYAEPKRARLT